VADARKQAEIEYPERVPAEGREWLHTKPFRNNPREVARHVIDFGYVVQLLEIEAGMEFCELACGSGWMTRWAARCGAHAVGYDISPGLIEIARAEARAEGVECEFEIGDMEELDLGRHFDAVLIYDGVHHSARPDLVVRTAARALRPGGRFLLAEPNWKHRFQGRAASEEYGTSELGYTPMQLKRLLRREGFTHIERFHNNRLRLFSNRPLDVVSHLAEPWVYRVLGPWWTRIWLRATAG
jgi:2-polyprenyl-3-methyl-5-hydroxy-6-metoxy-1,4-benzoquinol methylase